MKLLSLFYLLLLFASCKHTSEECVENPKQNCICTKEYKPVCGCNHKTYGNACMANCAGIAIYKEGECK